VEEVLDVDRLVDGVIDREGGYVNNSADKGGPTCFGTEAVARAYGYAGPMRQLPREEAAAIYKRLYWSRPRFDEVAKRSERVAAELFDTGVNMGPAVAVSRGGGHHANTAENFFSILKRGVIGTYHHWSEAHLHRYLAEFDMRYSTKDTTDGERAASILKGMEGRRLTYRRTAALAA